MKRKTEHESRLRWFAITAFLLLWLLAFSLGLAGIDFGNHWDESKPVVSVTESFKTGRFLPGWYNYPSMSYPDRLQGHVARLYAVA